MTAVLLTPSAELDLATFTAYERRLLVDAMEEYLTHDPFTVNKRRKRLQPNPLAPWELRIGNYRVFYVDEAPRLVKVVAIGVKHHNRLYIRGVRVEL